MSKLGDVTFHPQDGFRQDQRREIKAELKALVKNMGVWNPTVNQLRGLHHLSGGRWTVRCKDENGRIVHDGGKLKHLLDFDVWSSSYKAPPMPGRDPNDPAWDLTR